MQRYYKILSRVLLLVFCIAFIAFTGLLAIPVNADNSAPAKHSITQDDLIYFMMTDRFNDGDKTNNQNAKKDSMSSYHGGDFQGIIDKLDYIKDLGFTTIWISPVVENQVGGYHGYWATDFYKTNENFGPMEKLKELVTKAHEKDIKVIVDLVVNHTGQLHPWVSDPAYSDWFHDYGNIIDYNNQEEVELGNLSALPDLKQENTKVKKYLIDMAKWWIKETDIDGYRLDTTRHVAKDFWVDFVKEIKNDYPDFYMIGEVFNGDAAYVGSYQKTGLDGLVDFPMYYAMNDVFGGMQPATRLAEVINATNSAYTNKYMMGTFLDNHDVPRFISQITDSTDKRLTQALTFEMTYTGIPVMYYGTEIALDGGADPDNRKDMDFSAKSPITDVVRKLTKLRKDNMALTRGDFKLLQTDDNFISYSRSFESNTVIVSFNISDKKIDKALDLSQLQLNKRKTFVKQTDNSELKAKSNLLGISLEPREAAVYVLKPASAGAPTITLYAVLAVIAAAAVLAAVIIYLRVFKTSNKKS